MAALCSTRLSVGRNQYPGEHSGAAALARSLQEKLEAQRAIRELEEARRRKRQDVFKSQDAIDANRDTLIADMEKQLHKSQQCHPLFTIRWAITIP